MNQRKSTSLKIIYYPYDEVSFKQDLLKTQKAYVLLHKTDGNRESYVWSAKNIKPSSSINNNLRSGYVRDWRDRGIFKAEVSTNINDLPQFSKDFK